MSNANWKDHSWKVEHRILWEIAMRSDYIADQLLDGDASDLDSA
jgi:hypothetical protein